MNRSIPGNPRRICGGLMGRVLVAIGAFALISAIGISPMAQAQTVEEHDAKAAFVFKLVNFVQWRGATGDLVIGFIGADATGDSLQRLAYGKSVNGRKIVVRRLGYNDGEIKACQVIFVGASERKNTSAVLERIRGNTVLTVGESDGFGQHGGIVNLLLDEGRIRFEVNPHAAERAHLQISSRLLSLATIVADGS